MLFISSIIHYYALFDLVISIILSAYWLPILQGVAVEQGKLLVYVPDIVGGKRAKIEVEDVWLVSPDGPTGHQPIGNQ